MVLNFRHPPPTTKLANCLIWSIAATTANKTTSKEDQALKISAIVCTLRCIRGVKGQIQRKHKINSCAKGATTAKTYNVDCMKRGPTCWKKMVMVSLDVVVADPPAYLSMLACGKASANLTNEYDRVFSLDPSAYPAIPKKSNLMDGMFTPTARKTIAATNKRKTPTACAAAIFVRNKTDGLFTSLRHKGVAVSSTSVFDRTDLRWRKRVTCPRTKERTVAKRKT